MNSSNIIIIGAGNLGSRHLQALALMNKLINIDVIDPSEQALKVAKERLDQISINKNLNGIRFLSNMNNLREFIDVAIIATSSSIRKEVVEQLLKNRKIKYLILEKVVFQSYDDFLYIKELLDFYHVKAWVNCPRRMFSFYQALKQNLQKAEFIDLTVRGAQWGLGCNAIHMLDLYAFIIGENQMNIDISGLDYGWIDSKRKGFCEFTGRLEARSKLGKLDLMSYTKGSMPCVVDIASDEFRYIISEAEGKALVAKATNAWKWQECPFEVKYQSQLTNIVVENLLDTGKCDLTNYEESMQLHKNLLSAFLTHMNKTSKVELRQCPIT